MGDEAQTQYLLDCAALPALAKLIACDGSGLVDRSGDGVGGGVDRNQGGGGGEGLGGINGGRSGEIGGGDDGGGGGSGGGSSAVTHAAVCARACWVLSFVADGSVAQIGRLLAHRGLMPALVGLAGHRHVDIRTDALWAVANAVARGSPQQARAMLALGVARPLCAALERRRRWRRRPRKWEGGDTAPGGGGGSGRRAVSCNGDTMGRGCGDNNSDVNDDDDDDDDENGHDDADEALLEPALEALGRLVDLDVRAATQAIADTGGIEALEYLADGGCVESSKAIGVLRSLSMSPRW
jgi:hypothetical protein